MASRKEDVFRTGGILGRRPWQRDEGVRYGWRRREWVWLLNLHAVPGARAQLLRRDERAVGGGHHREEFDRRQRRTAGGSRVEGDYLLAVRGEEDGGRAHPGIEGGAEQRSFPRQLALGRVLPEAEHARRRDAGGRERAAERYEAHRRAAWISGEARLQSDAVGPFVHRSAGPEGLARACVERADVLVAGELRARRNQRRAAAAAAAAACIHHP